MSTQTMMPPATTPTAMPATTPGSRCEFMTLMKVKGVFGPRSP